MKVIVDSFKLQKALIETYKLTRISVIKDDLVLDGIDQNRDFGNKMAPIEGGKYDFIILRMNRQSTSQLKVALAMLDHQPIELELSNESIEIKAITKIDIQRTY